MAKVKTIGVDLAKNTFYLVALSATGEKIWRKKVSRNRLIPLLVQSACDTVVMEACSGAHHWARSLKAQGISVALLPPQHVKAYLRGQKNDYSDAEAIAEAYQHGRIRPTAVKTLTQQDLQSLFRVRQQLLKEQTALINQVRGLLAEYGVVIPQGKRCFCQSLPRIIEDATNELTPTIRQLLQRRYEQYRVLEEELGWHRTQLDALAKSDEHCQRLMSIPGYGPLVATAFSCWLGNGQQFKKGREASSALGLVPRQHSTGGRTVLLGITKRGDQSLRALLVHGARAAARVMADRDDALSQWFKRVEARRGHNKAVVALASKLARIGWSVVRQQTSYQIVQAAA